MPYPGTAPTASATGRLLENGLRLAKATGAAIEVVQLIAVFYDSRWVNEGIDYHHGERGAERAG
jgi:hypothetical protein